MELRENIARKLCENDRTYYPTPAYEDYGVSRSYLAEADQILSLIKEAGYLSPEEAGATRNEDTKVAGLCQNRQ